MADRNHHVIVLANRAPFKHERVNGRVMTTRSASGLVTALEPLLKAYSGTWVAHAAGSADLFAAGAPGESDVSPANSGYRTEYVALTDDMFRGYYYGFANEGLWPLCHNVDVTPVFRRADFEMYRAANARFADVVANEADRASPIVLVQDYHFALAPTLLRDRLPLSRVATFWHIPWPRYRTFAACPWARELVEGLIGSDIVGFQTDDDCQNFLGCVETLLPDAVLQWGEGTISYQGRMTSVRAYPVGVDCENPALTSAPSVSDCRVSARRELQLPADVRMGIGVDRMDYTKGLNDKFLAIERLLEKQPALIGKFAFVQIAEPSRDCLAAYREARDLACRTCQRINQRFGTTKLAAPIRFLETHHEPPDVYRYYRAADFCLVGSLHDGMNLVAKEFVAARSDGRGVLILSECTGAARQLRSALIVNPKRIGAVSNAIAQALEMSSIEQGIRMKLLRASVTTYDASWWAERIVHDVTRVSPALRHEAAEPRWAAAVA